MASFKVLNNTINMSAPVRDGYAIELGCGSNNDIGFEIGNNVITKATRGILVAGWSNSSSPGCGLGTIHDNTIFVSEPANESYSLGDPIGIQVRFGAHKIQIYNNNIKLNSGQGACPTNFATDTGTNCIGYGIKLMGGTNGVNNQAYNNTITATTNTTDVNFAATGMYGDETSDSLSYFSGNTVTGNSQLVSVSETDGCGNNWLFKGNTFIEAANPQSFVTTRISWYCNPGQDTTNTVFLDNTYQGGASPDDLGVPGSGNTYSYFVRWSYNVTVKNASGNPVSGATVTAIATGGGSETVTGTTDVNGNATLVLTDHSAAGISYSSPTTVSYTAHNVTVTATGCTVSPFQITLHQTTSQAITCQ
jgi:hypothetical protein